MISLPNFLNKLFSVLILVGTLIPYPASGADVPSPLPRSRIAIFPLENLSGTPAPLRELRDEITTAMRSKGLTIIEPSTVDSFIENQHVRYLGGIDEKTASLLKEKTGADLVLLTTVELYSDVLPPKFSLISRLVRLEGVPEILWMDSVGIAGDDAQGFLGIGLINDIKKLRKKGITSIAASLESGLKKPQYRRKQFPVKVRKEEPFTLTDLIQGIKKERPRLNSMLPPPKPETVEELLRKMKASGGLFMSRYAPVDWYSSQDMRADQERTIAIIPFFNRSTRKHAADLQVLHLAKQLVINGSFRVLELGVIRDKMLSMHVIMNDGISIPSMDLITISLGVDLLLNGLVFDYQDTVGYGSHPRVDFSLQMFERDTKKILWSSHSHNKGDDGVFFFDYGRIATAGTLSDKMCRALVLKLVDNAL